MMKSLINNLFLFPFNELPIIYFIILNLFDYFISDFYELYWHRHPGPKHVKTERKFMSLLQIQDMKGSVPPRISASDIISFLRVVEGI